MIKKRKEYYIRAKGEIVSMCQNYVAMNAVSVPCVKKNFLICLSNIKKALNYSKNETFDFYKLELYYVCPNHNEALRILDAKNTDELFIYISNMSEELRSNLYYNVEQRRICKLLCK